MKRRRGRALGPLRKIVRCEMRAVTQSGVELLFEILECGHAQRPINDIYGETVAVRRRCRECRKEESSAT